MILEAKLSVLSDIDKPASPAGEAFKDYRFNIEENHRKLDLNTEKNYQYSREEIIEAAEQLKGQPNSCFSIINPNLEKKASEEGFQIRRI